MSRENVSVFKQWKITFKRFVANDEHFFSVSAYYINSIVTQKISETQAGTNVFGGKN